MFIPFADDPSAFPTTWPQIGLAATLVPLFIAIGVAIAKWLPPTFDYLFKSQKQKDDTAAAKQKHDDKEYRAGYVQAHGHLAAENSRLWKTNSEMQSALTDAQLSLAETEGDVRLLYYQVDMFRNMLINRGEKPEKIEMPPSRRRNGVHDVERQLANVKQNSINLQALKDKQQTTPQN